MILDPSTVPARDMYQHLISLILPRPIAWVSTVSAEGASNLAPFSFFMGVTAQPASLAFCPANDRHGRPKDTLRNIEATGEFVVCLVPGFLGAKMNETAAPLPHGDSEFAKAGLQPVPSLRVRPPRVEGSPAAFECKLHSITRVGEGPLAGNIVVGLIQCIHILDAALGADGRADPGKMDLIGRLGGEQYCRTGDRFTLGRSS